jgi:uncharacterized protein (DUF3084 family)
MAKKTTKASEAASEDVIKAAKDECFRLVQERARLMDAARDMRAGRKDLVDDADPENLDDVDEEAGVEAFKIDVRLEVSAKRLRAINARLRELSRLSTTGQTVMPGA